MFSSLTNVHLPRQFLPQKQHDKLNWNSTQYRIVLRVMGSCSGSIACASAKHNNNSENHDRSVWVTRN